MKSLLTLYYDSKIIPNKVFFVDDIEDYLDTLTSDSIDNFQYIKNALELTIKIDLSQTNLETKAGNLNYCSIQNNGSGPVALRGSKYYYFITNKTWIAEHTIMLHLSMDTINTFKPSIDFNFSDKTKILREHKDRFINYGGNWYRNIDLYSEGLTPILYCDSQELITQKADVDWYLIYKNQNNPSESLENPVDCFLCASEEVDLRGISGYSLALNDLEEGKYYYLIDTDSPTGSLLVNDENLSMYQELGNYEINALCIWKESPKIIVLPMHFQSALSQFNIIYKFLSSNYYDYKTENPIKLKDFAKLYKTTLNPFSTPFKSDIIASAYEDISEDSITTINSIHSLDRTDSKLIKVIKLPYAPLKIDENGFFDGASWEFDNATAFLKLKDLSTKFDYKFIPDNAMESPFAIFSNFNWGLETTESLRNKIYESKLYHSDYYQQKFVYDSFGFVFRNELVSFESLYFTDYEDFEIEYVVTSTINSRFMFKFPQYILDYASEDYENVLPIARNNEITLFNQQYMNYLRNGYNYDVKTKQRQEIASWIGVGLSAVGSITSFALGGVTGGLSIAGGVALATTTAGQVISAVNTTAQSEQNLSAKQQQLKAQSTGVSGSDDVDLMSNYTNNRAKLCIYRVSPKLEQALFDCFFYTGYISNRMGIPELTSRIYFNFVSCEPIINPIKNISEEIMDDLKIKYGAGVTFLHHYNNKWDFEQVYENWETSLNIPDE